MCDFAHWIANNCRSRSSAAAVLGAMTTHSPETSHPSVLRIWDSAIWQSRWPGADESMCLYGFHYYCQSDALCTIPPIRFRIGGIVHSASDNALM